MIFVVTWYLCNQTIFFPNLWNFSPWRTLRDPLRHHIRIEDTKILCTCLQYIQKVIIITRLTALVPQVKLLLTIRHLFTMFWKTFMNRNKMMVVFVDGRKRKCGKEWTLDGCQSITHSFTHSLTRRDKLFPPVHLLACFFGEGGGKRKIWRKSEILHQHQKPRTVSTWPEAWPRKPQFIYSVYRYTVWIQYILPIQTNCFNINRVTGE